MLAVCNLDDVATEGDEFQGTVPYTDLGGQRGSDIDCKVANTHEICTAYIPPHALYPLRVFKMGKQRKYLVLAPLAPITASRTSLQQPQPTPEYIVGLEVEYFEYYPHFSVLTGEVMHGLELTKND